MKEANAASAREASASLQASLDDAASVADSEPTSDSRVKVDVESTVEKKGEVETTTTNVKIEMPKHSSELPLPESPEEMIEKAKQMVKEAQKLDGNMEPSSRKRKAEELEEDENTDEEGDSDLQPAKRARLLEQQVKKEKVRNRALVGVAATMVIGSVDVGLFPSKLLMQHPVQLFPILPARTVFSSPYMRQGHLALFPAWLSCKRRRGILVYNNTSPTLQQAQSLFFLCK